MFRNWRYVSTHPVRDPQKALDAFQKVAKMMQDDAIVLKEIGLAYYALHEYQKAIETWERLLRARSEDAPWMDMGIIYAQLGNFEKALKAFGKVIKEMPNNHYALKEMGLAYRHLGRIRETRECFELARLKAEKDGNAQAAKNYSELAESI